MKRMFRLAVMAIVSTLVVACAGSSHKANSEPVWDEASIVSYVNLGQLHTKSNIAGLDLTALLDQIVESDTQKQIVKSILSNPNSSGIAADKPAYVVIRDFDKQFEPSDVYFACEVCDADKFDQTLKSIAGSDFNQTKFTLEGDRRIFTEENSEFAFGYDSKRLIILFNSNEQADLKTLLNTQLNYAPADMSRFESNDMSTYLDIDKLYNKAVALLNTNDTDAEVLELIKSYYNGYFEDEASIVFSLTFNRGSIVVDTDCEGISDEMMSLYKKCNGQLLNLLNTSPIAVFNIGLDGEAIATTIDTAINTIIATNPDIEINNETNMYKNIALGAVGSFKGDFLIALSEANGKIERMNPVFTSANALFAAEVKDDYIWQNIKTFAGGFLTPDGSNSYSIEANGNKFSIGQRDNIFYAGVNNNCDAKSNSAANDKWAKEIEDCYAFIMIDFNKFVNSSFGNAVVTALYNEVNRSERETAKRVVNALDVLTIVTTGEDNNVSSKCTLTLKDDSVNSLEQITKLIFDVTIN